MRRAGALSLLLSLAACSQPEPPPAPPPRPARAVEAPPPGARFVEVAAQVGIGFVHHNGAFGSKWLPETMGSGVIVFDHEGDGDPDLYFINSMDFEGQASGRASLPALYRNDGGRFSDITAEAGLAEPYYGQGGAAADYDADGDTDLFVNGLGRGRLYRNDGGRYTDVAAEAGILDDGYGSCASWLDADGDGWLDLFVCHYVEWTPETDIHCSLDGENKSYCTPEAYHGRSNRLYRNLGDGRFEDVTEAAGLWNPDGKTLGVVAFDADGDGDSDIAVANDTEPNNLYLNHGDGRFEDIGVASGIAFSEDGMARGAMGIDAADYDASGRQSIVIGNFSNEMIALYHNEGGGLFLDDAAPAGIGVSSLLTLAFGTFFFDYDLDGRLDVFAANGHVEDAIQEVQSDVSHAQPPHLFHNLGQGRFEDVAPLLGGDLVRPMVGRGAAHLDYDSDGDLDIVVTTNAGPARLFRNDLESGGRSLRVLLEGRPPNRDALGAVVTLSVEGLPGSNGVTRVSRERRAAASYLSQSEPWLSFGLGPEGRPLALELRWPDGSTQRVEQLEAGASLHVRQPEP